MHKICYHIHVGKTKYIHRAIETLLRSRLKTFPSLILTGPRQTGKSTLLQTIFPSYNYVSLDSPLERQLAISDPLSFLSENKTPLIIDEIQYAPNLLPYIKIHIDKTRSKKGQFILTGSQCFPLMAGITESLAGRVSVNELLGFSIEELPHKKISTDTCYSSIYKGAFPEVALGRIPAPDFYDAYLKTYIERDLRQITSVRDLLTFQNFIELLAARSANILNLNEISKECGISHTSAQKWLSILTNGRIVYLLRPYSKNLSKRVVKRPKIYFIDTGLMSYILRYPSKEILIKGSIKGHAFETFIIMDVLKYKINHGKLFEMYFLRDSNHNEVDLLIELANQIIPIEIKATATPNPKHWQSLKKLKNMFGSDKAYLVSLCPEKLKLDNGIINIPYNQITDILKQLH